ncbi:RND multidrug efflux transporter, Acriflavin resistance protein [Klebsiella pneumoniae]|uniref:RND multidrug efflux transporter, Acriflavin resistance protein n=1 Tax=Klebsiella pneumoniae TaxID=573 RepID=A0A447S2F8_KLEPN|nr:RND multidrug efflux transporter, Acriflavin resistance protein [Klebsiella pneumoniae]
MLTFFIRRPRFAMVIALLLTFVGAVSLKLIPVEQYPAITPPVVNVSASWPGASASDVAEAIAAPLETQLNGVDHMLYMESTSSDEGTYRLSITFAAGTDADLAAIDVQNRVAQALAQLPAEVQQNGVQVRKRASNLLMGVSLYSPLARCRRCLSATTPAPRCARRWPACPASARSRCLAPGITACVSGCARTA